MITGIILGIVQFLIFYFGLDHLVTLGPYVTHHFIELFAFGFIGYGLFECFDKLKFDRKQGEILVLVGYCMMLLLPGRDFKAKLTVSWTLPIGSFVHRIRTILNEKRT